MYQCQLSSIHTYSRMAGPALQLASSQAFFGGTHTSAGSGLQHDLESVDDSAAFSTHLPLFALWVRGGDSIEHYSRCRVVRNTCYRFLNCDPNIFATLHSFVLATPLITTRTSLAIAGLLVYATYTTVNALRHQGNDGAICERTALDAISQAIGEGARSHGFATAVLRSRWSTTNNDEQQIPQRPLQAFQTDIESLRALARDSSRRVRRRLV